MACAYRSYSTAVEVGPTASWFSQKPWDAQREQAVMLAQQQRQQRLQRLAEVAHMFNHPAAPAISSRIVSESNLDPVGIGGRADVAPGMPPPVLRGKSVATAGLSPQPSGQLPGMCPSGPSGQILGACPSAPSGQLLGACPSGPMPGNISRGITANAPLAEDSLSRLMAYSKDAEMRSAARIKTLQEEQQRLSQLARAAAEVVAGRVPTAARAASDPTPTPEAAPSPAPALFNQAISGPLVGASPFQDPTWGTVPGSVMHGNGPSYQQHLSAPRRPEGSAFSPSPADWFNRGPLTMSEARGAGNLLQYDPSLQFQTPAMQVPAVEPPPPSRLPPPNPDELDLELKAGLMGVDVEPKSGLVESVDPAGQLASSGLATPLDGKGWFVHSVNGADYSDQALKAAAAGGSNFRVLFRKKDLPPPPPVETPVAAAPPIVTSQSEKPPEKGKAKAKAKSKAKAKANKSWSPFG